MSAGSEWQAADERGANGWGYWVFVCGPSGAGKDSVLRWANGQLRHHAGIVFSRRMITRPPELGSDHEPVTPDRYARLLGSGALSWAWEAHGFHYGISSAYASEVAKGKVVVINGSREHVAAQDANSQVRVVQVLADQQELLQRLQRRGRDSAASVQQRLQRNSQFAEFTEDLRIYNQGELAQAGGQLAAYLRELAKG